MDWVGQPSDVVFQFWFVVGLILFCAILAPVKWQVNQLLDDPEVRAGMIDAERSEPWRNAICAGISVLACARIAALVLVWFILIPICKKFFAGPISSMGTGSGGEHWGWPTTEAGAKDFIADNIGYFQVTLSSIMVVYTFPRASARYTLIGWIVILNTYVTRCLEYRDSSARLVNALDL